LAHSSARPSPARSERNALPISMPGSNIGRRLIIRLRQRLKPGPNPAARIRRSGSRRLPARQRVRQAWQLRSAPSEAGLPAIRGELWAGGREACWRSISTGRSPSRENPGIPARRKMPGQRPRSPDLEGRIWPDTGQLGLSLFPGHGCFRLFDQIFDELVQT
jgi:hypothetical protein